jgi:hypothetical protein
MSSLVKPLRIISCLVKRSRALLGSNPTRNNQARAGERSRGALAGTMGGSDRGSLASCLIHLSCLCLRKPTWTCVLVSRRSVLATSLVRLAW